MQDDLVEPGRREPEEVALRHRKDLSLVRPLHPERRLAHPPGPLPADLAGRHVVEAPEVAHGAEHGEVHPLGGLAAVEELLADRDVDLLQHAADLQHAHGVGLAAVVEERVLLEDGPVDLPVHHELQLLGQRAERLDVLPVRAASLRVLVDLDEGDDAVAEAEGQVVLGDEATELLLLVHVAPSERDEPGHRGGDGADEGGEERHGQQDHDDREDALARGPRVDVRGRRRELRQ
mmetsp:Transcript_56627/g.160761  ORF Transcript_56627/g.160761 Transcript_56627/m.160761 type:complete len:234 (+) Transcript_56627:335-1036(+)